MKVRQEIDYSNIKFDSPIKLNNGKYFINASINEDDILVQLGPNLQTISDISSVLDVRLSNQNNIDLLREAEDQMLQFAKDNKDDWFPDSGITNDYLDNAIMSFVKPVHKSPDVVFRMRTSSKLCVYNSSREEIEKDIVLENTALSCIVQLSGLWFTKTRFGVVWKVFQIKLNPDKKKKPICLFEDAEDDINDEIENVFPDCD